MRRFLAALVVGGALMISAPVLAADDAPATTREFEKTQRLEELRYKNLWLAYGAAWLVIFGFAWRTWKKAEATDRSLGDLKRRVKELEARDG